MEVSRLWRLKNYMLNPKKNGFRPEKSVPVLEPIRQNTNKVVVYQASFISSSTEVSMSSR